MLRRELLLLRELALGRRRHPIGRSLRNKGGGSSIRVVSAAAKKRRGAEWLAGRRTVYGWKCCAALADAFAAFACLPAGGDLRSVESAAPAVHLELVRLKDFELAILAAGISRPARTRAASIRGDSVSAVAMIAPRVLRLGISYRSVASVRVGVKARGGAGRGQGLRRPGRPDLAPRRARQPRRA